MADEKKFVEMTPMSPLSGGNETDDPEKVVKTDLRMDSINHDYLEKEIKNNPKLNALEPIFEGDEKALWKTGNREGDTEKNDAKADYMDNRHATLDKLMLGEEVPIDRRSSSISLAWQTSYQDLKQGNVK